MISVSESEGTHLTEATESRSNKEMRHSSSQKYLRVLLSDAITERISWCWNERCQVRELASVRSIDEGFLSRVKQLLKTLGE